MANEKETVAIPFALAGLFATNKPIEQVLRTDLSEEELEEIQNFLAKKLFKDPEVAVVIFPALVPPEQAPEAVKELENFIFGEEEQT
jgi:hypothetical protein